MKRFKFQSLRLRLITWFLVITLIPLLFVIVLTYFQRSSYIREDAENKLIAIRDLKAMSLINWLSEREADIVAISSDKKFNELEVFWNKDLTTLSLAQEEIVKEGRDKLILYMKTYESYNELFIINPKDGRILISSNSENEGIDESNNYYFQEPMRTRGLCIKDIHYSKTIKDYSMTYSIPIFCTTHKGKDIIGILVARIDLNNSLYKMLLNRVGLGETGETLIVNNEGIALNELRWYDNAPLNLKIYADPAVNAYKGNTGIIQSDDYRGEEVLAAYTYIPEMKWGFVCKQDLKELNAPITTMLKYFIMLFFIIAIIIIIVSLLLSKYISRPLVAMEKNAKKVGSGDFSIRNQITSNDEFGTLAFEINNMVDETVLKMNILKGLTLISDTINGINSMQEYAKSLVLQLMNLTSAGMSTFYILNEIDSTFEHYFSIGANEKMLKPFSSKNPQGEFGLVISQKEIRYIKDIPADSIFNFNTVAGELIPKEIITLPILIENSVVAIISLVNVNEFPSGSIEILKQSWVGINITYSNIVANERTQIFANQLSRTNQQLEAQTEELQEQSEELQSQTEELQSAASELKIKNIELEAQKDHVESANKLKSEFLSNMSHELRTPLNSIITLSKILLEQVSAKIDKDEYNYLEIVERNGVRLLNLINDILDLSKLEAGKMDVFPEKISIKELLKIVRDSISPLAGKKGLRIILNIPDDFPPAVTDESRLHQILVNIVGNAVKFTNEGLVEISASYDNENVFIKIKDSGIGISEEMLPHIFDEFRQSDSSSSRRFDGTGLGLAIVKKLINILGGSINVKSKLGYGSEFTVIIPLLWRSDAIISNDMQIGLNKAKNIFTGIKNGLGIDSDFKLILIVEDNPDSSTQLKAVLERAGYKTESASNGQEALNHLENIMPDGIILDLMMPGIDGFEVLEKIRNNEKTSHLPVLILTAKDLSKDDLMRLKYNNIKQLLIKGDVDLNELLRKVKLMISEGNNNEEATEVITNQENLSQKKINAMENIKSDKLENKVSNDLPLLLIVEDNEDNMTTIKAILKNKFNIIEAIDGEQGLKSILKMSPDIVLLDMGLPKMSGEEIIHILKNNKETQNMPIIAVTALAMKEDKERIMESGGDGYVSKPIDAEYLLKEIERLLDGNNQK